MDESVSEGDFGQVSDLASPAKATRATTSRRRQPMARDIYGDVIQFLEFVTIIGLSLAIAYFYHIEVLIADFDFQQYASAGIVAATVFTAMLRRDGYYEFDGLLSSGRTLRGVLARWSVVMLGLTTFAFALKISDAFSRVWLFTWAIGSCAALVVGRVAAAAYLRRAAREGGVFGRRVALVGATPSAEAFIAQVAKPELAISVVGVFSCDTLQTPGSASSGQLPDQPDIELSGDVEELERLARSGKVDDIIIAIPGAGRDSMADLIQRLSILPVAVSILSSVHWLDHMGGGVVRIGGAPALSLYRRPLEGWGGVVKTIEDRLLGGFFFVLALPLLAACAIALKIQGAGPILFAQKRHGFNHEVFRIYKFRTMTVAEDGDVVTQARREDARVTLVGAFLRKWSLDELPQLLNVMKGDMSLVGPRPHALAHNHEYAKTIENYSGRHKVKPGITGWAQVNGYRGETSETEQMENRVKYDLEYIDNWSLWFDMKIFVLTVAAVLFPRNAH